MLSKVFSMRLICVNPPAPSGPPGCEAKVVFLIVLNDWGIRINGARDFKRDRLDTMIWFHISALIRLRSQFISL